jgi:hypothetical protein
MARQAALYCVNCADPVHGRAGGAGRGPDIAWFIHCWPCAELVQNQMEPVEELSAAGNIVIYRCRTCGFERTCRPGWRTRCHVCLDERAADVPAFDLGQDMLKYLRDDEDALREIRQFLGMRRRAPIPVRGAGEFRSAISLDGELDRFRRSGWTVLAGDVHGLPWYGQRYGPPSHGTWGYHDECGTLQKMAQGALDCVTCGPQPGSRTHLARQDDPYLLYLVRFGRVQKFGVGDYRRVREHQRFGAEVVQVLTSRHADVVKAELALKRQHRDRAILRGRQRMPISFGTGTEVIPRRIPVDLSQVLPHGDDVTHRFDATYEAQW